MKRLCKWCQHPKYKHNIYPLYYPFCKGKGLGIPNGSCTCGMYVPFNNLEWLEYKYEQKEVNNNVPT